MIRRLLDLATVLSVLAGLLLGAAGLAEAPRWPHAVGSPTRGWELVVHRGRISLDRFAAGGAFVSVTFSVPFDPVTIALIVLPLAVGGWWDVVHRRQPAGGFPVQHPGANH